MRDWQQGQSKVMYWLSMSITDGMMGYLQDAETPAIAWKNLGRVFEVNTKARKLQLKSELNQVKRNNLSINDYALKIKSIIEALGSIKVSVEDDDIVRACLDGLGDEYVHFRSSMNTRDDIPVFQDLISMLILEEKNLDTSSSHGRNNSEQAFYSNSNRGRGRGCGRGPRGCRGQFLEGQSNQNNTGGRGNQSQGRGSQRGRGAGSSRQQHTPDSRGCWTCGERGHMSRDCPKGKASRKREQGNYASTSRDADDSKNERMFVMQHVMNTMTAENSTQDDVWYVDSGASNHMTSRGEWFRDMRKPDVSGYVQTGDDTAHPIAHVGGIPLNTKSGKSKYLADVLHVPNITKNLVSVGQMVEQGLQVRFNPNGCYVEDFQNGCKLITEGKCVGTMFTLNVDMPEVKAALFAQGTGVLADVDICHKRIGHVNEQRLRSMQSKQIVKGLPKFKVDGMHKVCAACQFGKQSKGSFPHERNVCKKPLEVVHTDVWGPTDTASIHGCRYYVSFIDDHTRKVWVYFMRNKSEVFGHFQDFKVMIEKETDMQIKTLRSDGGGEYFSNDFSDFLRMHGIHRQFTCRYTPQQNGVAERKNRHIAEVARALMNEKNMPHHFWAEAVNTAVYIMNRTPTAAVHDVTPEEKFTGTKPDLAHLKVFGCIAYVHVPDELRRKLDPKAEKCILVGYSLEQKGYRCYNPTTRELRVSRDVVFDEMSSWY
ncbi:DDE-type integrase/transposase/recombinase, partial [Enterobacter cloacae complex sp. GF14B]|uniref:DDE-type integrase/transposase/recombinase n=1 Tax=Enterobacter cloacae complex sp. GF14B TaxID=2511982 RepID=UPI0011132BFB